MMLENRHSALEFRYKVDIIQLLFRLIFARLLRVIMH